MSKRLLILIGSLALVVVLTLGVTAAVFAQTSGPNNGSGTGYGPGGMMNGGTSYGQGGMMNGGAGNGQGGMMGNNNSSNNGSSQPLTVDGAKNAATQYLASFYSNNSKLAIDEIMVFDNNAYVAIKDKSLGVGAFELLVSSSTKTAYGEPGPNMMWNLLYGHMSGNYPNGSGNGMMGQGGMMGGYGNGMMNHGSAMMGGLSTIDPATYQPGKMPITAEQALKAAQTYLDEAYPGVKASATADEFPGYYTVDVETNGKISGMLSVNGYTGQVWYHTWHGKFIQMADFG
jgi:hypothetical protein